MEKSDHFIVQNGKSTRGGYILENGKEKLIAAAEADDDSIPFAIRIFAKRVAEEIEDKTTPKELLQTVFHCYVELKEDPLITEMKAQEKYFPLLIDNIGDTEFARSFRRWFGIYITEVAPEKIKLELGEVYIGNKDKAEILEKLFQGAKKSKLVKLLQKKGENLKITEQVAGDLLSVCKEFIFLDGVTLKVNLSGDVLKTKGYNKANGEGAAERIVASCRNI